MTIQRKKEAVVLVFTTAYSLLFFVILRLLIQNGLVWSVWFNIIAIVGSLLWTAILASATAFVINHVGVNVSLLILPPAALLLATPLSIASLIGALFLATTMFVAQQTIHREMKSRVTFNIPPIFRAGVRNVIFGLVIAIIAITIPFSRDSAQASAIHIPTRYMEIMLIPATPIMKNFIPGYTNQVTIDQIIDAQIKKQSQGLPPGVIIASDQRARARMQLSEQLGVSLNGSETIPFIAAAFMNRYIDGLANGNQIVVVVATVAIALLLFRILAPVLVWPTLGLVAVVVDIAKRTGLVTIEKNQVTIERLHL